MREAAEAPTADPELAPEELHEVSYPEGRSLWRGLDAVLTPPLTPSQGVPASPRNLRSIDDVPQEDEDALSSTGSDFSHITIMRSGPRWVGSVRQWQELNLKPIANRIRALCYWTNVIRQWRRFTRRRRCLRALSGLRLYLNGLTREPGVLEHVARYSF